MINNFIDKELEELFMKFISILHTGAVANIEKMKSITFVGHYAVEFNNMKKAFSKAVIETNNGAIILKELIIRSLGDLEYSEGSRAEAEEVKQILREEIDIREGKAAKRTDFINDNEIIKNEEVGQ